MNTTSELAKAAAELADAGGQAGALNTASTSLPDVAVLARMANEFFHALPGKEQLAQTVAPAATQPLATAAEAALRDLPTMLQQAASPAQSVAVPGVAVPGIPGGVSPGDFSVTPAFAFLQDARSLTAAQSAVPVHAIPPPATTQVPSGVEMLTLTTLVPGTTKAIPHAAANEPLASKPATASGGPTETEARALTMVQPGIEKNVQAPVIQTPGFPGGFPAIERSVDPSFSFLEEARSPVGPTPMPTAISAANDTGATAVLPPASGETLTEAELMALPETLGGVSVPRVPALASEVALPQIPGTVAHAGDFGLGDFGFLDEADALEPLTASPSLAPITSQFGATPFPEISSIPFDVNAIRRDFPILQERVNGRQLVWLDNAATTQKPQAVIDRLSYFYAHENSNIHRAAHTLAARATDAYEAAREKVRRFLNAPSTREIIFVRGATEAINLVAQSWGRRNVQKDDEIVITWLEHHANIVPWQMLCSEKGARLRVAPVDDSGQIILEEYEKLLGPRTKLVALAHVSNALGTVTPVEEMIAMAHRHGARVLVDGAQAVSHMRVDMQAYDCDFYVFSGHKIFAPTGIGVVFGKSKVLDATPPWQGGGNMIADVTFERTLYQPPPVRFEAGTGSIADAVGLGAALDYLDRIGMVNISRYEHDLLVYATNALQQIPGLHLIGTAREKASVLSFVLDGFRTEDIGAALNQEGIAVRSGHHCAQPILRRYGLESTVRSSLAFYNTCEEIDSLVTALWNLKGGRNPGL